MPTVLVTGGCGFIGRYVVNELLKHGQYRVRVADIERTPESHSFEREGIEFVQADLRKKSCALATMEGVEACIALAARSAGIGYFNRHPAEMLNDNLKIHSHTFEAARVQSLKRLVYVSSSCVFDRSIEHPVTEQALLSATLPPEGYPFSKLVGEVYCKAYLKQYGVPYTIVRPFNAYGPGEEPRKPGDAHVIPDLVGKILNGQWPLEIFGDGQQTRCFTHVKDIARGIVLSMVKEEALNEDFNLGHPTEINILRLAEKLWRICGRQEVFAVKQLPAFKHDVRRRGVNIQKAREQLGWEPEIDLDHGLRGVCAWLKEKITSTSMVL